MERCALSRLPGGLPAPPVGCWPRACRRWPRPPRRRARRSKDLVASSEDFIERAATQSSLSGKPYQVRCAGQTRNSADWLNQELRRLRQAP
ncbi:DUF5329 family protein [Pseudomonas aeruginosa]|uniref:DUF5329 family protein n=1 Tax=Pseudomonas aeruginosa TaxID=287 RepID=UPI001CF14B66|nr:DUF5329 family protein [Pseudomonas aeruginosa]MCA6833617.1 DUF5329 domain-containing protein [Pseudomonas aeruginosa]MDU0393182.1 DUF5329 family protein [Pseudomonas aeruginosa]